jgi:hypothetical protein
MAARVTLVSGLFYISRDKWKHSGFPPNYDRYKDWIKNILSLDTNLILFTDDYYYDYVVEISNQYSSKLENVLIIKKHLNELETFKNYYKPISCIMKSPEFQHYSTINPVAEMCYPLYNVIMFDKINLIKQSKELNPFHSDYFYWTDAGAFRDEITKYQNQQWPDVSNKIYFNNKLTFFSHRGTNYNIDNQKDYFTSQNRVVHGGYFIVPSDKVEFLKNEFDKVVDEILEDGYIGSDEKIFDLICKRHPDQVNMIQADWFEFYPMCSYKSKIDLLVVVAKYNENIEWTNNLIHPKIIYNKLESDNHLYEHNLFNIGREGHTFFHHIVNNYDNLNEYTAFVQGNPFDHCPKTLDIINEFQGDVNFIALGGKYLFEDDLKIGEEIKAYARLIGFDVTFPVYDTAGGQFIIHRNHILSRDLEFYKRVLNSLLDPSITIQSGYDVEKTTFQLFNRYLPDRYAQ